MKEPRSWMYDRVCDQPVNQKYLHRHNWKTSSLVNHSSNANNNIVIKIINK